ncbi:hypothetical protein POM88_043371 [Heracleum sosnowskyi]|uniref:RRM domain-containing protein n=1 Tax=Heracleum sosnowskyi TaxID=360622 RepID=A0AAD8H0X2_9APIA|nr:hypothetical protein POM88_043371 [Heracleum sosnowskyi]
MDFDNQEIVNSYVGKDQWYRVEKGTMNGRYRAVPEKEENGWHSQFKIPSWQQGRTYVEPLRGEQLNNTYKGALVSVLTHNLPTQASAREIWNLFGSKEDITDIILPKKRDVNNSRIGFVLVRTQAITGKVDIKI